MAKKSIVFKTKGMNRDLSVSAFNPEFAFENRNLRLSTNENNTLMSWVNEKGTEEIPIVAENGNGSASETAFTISGTPIGTAIINHYLILFTTYRSAPNQGLDFILRLKYTDDTKTKLQCKVISISTPEYLEFSVDHPLETLVSYESEKVQKVYWTDGVKQPRVVNITESYGTTGGTNCRFDFVRELRLAEVIKVEKQLSASGLFAPGVIQYAFTYYNKYGQESNIFYTSPLQYISYKERGASPEDKVENAFKISVQNPDSQNFKFLRIYSIQRTSINGTPICKRVQDISLAGVSVSGTVTYVDTGTSGNTIDPTELLYKGGDTIAVETMEQKDNTLFMGGITLTRPSIVSIRSSLLFGIDDTTTRRFTATNVSSGYYKYYNQLTSKGVGSRHSGMTVPCGGFKTGETYRLGVQFQHKSGKWSEPMFIRDGIAKGKFNFTIANDGTGTVTVPIFQGNLVTGASTLTKAGYKRMRPVVVFPSMIDRSIICQGVVAPTVYHDASRNTDNSCFAQSSWFFRPLEDDDADDIYYSEAEGHSVVTIPPKSTGALRYTSRQISGSFPESKAVFNPKYIRQVEIEGEYNSNNQFSIDRLYRTLHSPDIEFDDQVSLIDFTGKYFNQRGKVSFESTMSDIEIQTETPTVSSMGGGFVHRPLSYQRVNTNVSGGKGIVSGLFYDDFLADDHIGSNNDMGPYPYQKQSCKWLVYPWQSSGYLNNDMNRPSDKGVPSSKLKKKVISNLRYTTTTLNDYSEFMGYPFTNAPQIFNSDEVSVIKTDNKLYKGNIDTMLTPDAPDGKYFCFNGWVDQDVQTPFNSDAWCKTFNKNPNTQDENGIRKWNRTSEWEYDGSDIGDDYIDLVLKKNPVRMKYKSTPHLFGYFSRLSGSVLSENYGDLAIVEIKQTVTNRYGGTSPDALRENIWVPCGEPVTIADNANIYWDYGDTYFQRYDCLKTYAFTKEDPNQIVEIGSFMLETRVNIDGRYDRNRGQSNNLNMSPQNFNLINPVYSQIDNFFTYRIMPDDFYDDNRFPNQITWSKTKENGADVDVWTNVTLASILELDGNKGEITALKRFNDQLLCFQDTGISQILYNENTQISTTEGVPIEIANSGKVQGKRYLSNTIGCSNKWSIVTTPMGVYFMDSNDKSIYLYNGQLNNISVAGGMNSWCKKMIPSGERKWTPSFTESQQQSVFRGVYDLQNQDVLWVNKNTALAWNEKLQVFTSFYDYGDTPFFCNLDDTGIWVKSDGYLWKHQAGDYCYIFNEEKPYWTVLVGNPEPQLDKIFTNLEFRASVDGDVIPTYDTGGNLVYVTMMPFTYLEVWDEYQHGYTELLEMNGHDAFLHHTPDMDSSLKRKFRIWRCDIPRNNCLLDDDREGNEAYSTDADLGISRHIRKPLDRIRNPWVYIKLKQEAVSVESRVEIHDIALTYFG